MPAATATMYIYHELVHRNMKLLVIELPEGYEAAYITAANSRYSRGRGLTLEDVKALDEESVLTLIPNKPGSMLEEARKAFWSVANQLSD